MTKKSKSGKQSGQVVTLVRTRPASAQPHDVVRTATLGQSFAKGAAASIYTIQPAHQGGVVAKIYNDQYRTDASIRADEKLIALVVRHDELRSRLPFVLWPDELVFDRADVSPANQREALLGFTMPRLPAGTISLYTLMKQAKYRGHFQSGATGRVAARIADCLARLHAAGIVFCDLNPKNIHVSKDLDEVYFLDADGYQVTLGGKAIPSRGVTEGYASPGAIANHATNPLAVRSAADDNFVLAILAFQLLLDRAHPFATGPQYADHPAASHNDNIAARRFAFADVARYHPDADAAELYARLVTPLKEAFHRSFLGAHPLTAAEWAQLLTVHLSAPLAVSPTPAPGPDAINMATPSQHPQTKAARRAPSRPLKSEASSQSSNVASQTPSGRAVVAAMIAVPLVLMSFGNFRSKSVDAPVETEVLAAGSEKPRALPPERTRIINASLSPEVKRMLRELPGTLDDIAATVQAKTASSYKD